MYNLGQGAQFYALQATGKLVLRFSAQPFAEILGETDYPPFKKAPLVHLASTHDDLFLEVASSLL